jgi:hypothetical protein
MGSILLVTGIPVQGEDANPCLPAARSILFSFSIPVMDKFSREREGIAAVARRSPPSEKHNLTT